MSLLNNILGLFHAPEPTPAVQAARDAVDGTVERAGLAPANGAPSELELTDECVQLIERDEGCRLTAYPDPGTGGAPWTIGYGHTGSDVHPGLTITQARAEELLEQDLEKFEAGVEGVAEFKDGSDASDRQFSAMVSLAYNIGLGNFTKSSVLRFHNAGQFPQAADAFLLWNKSGGRVMNGLVRRRHQEREMYLGLEIDP